MNDVQPLVVLHGGPGVSNAVIQFAALAKCFGVNAEVTNIQTENLTLPPSNSNNPRIIAVDIGSLGFCTNTEILAIEELLFEQSSIVLLLATSADRTANEILCRFTKDVVSGIEPLCDARTVQFTAGCELASELASYRFTCGSGERLGLSLPTGGEVIMALNGRAAYIQMTRGRSEVFVWSTPTVFDPQRLLSAELEFEQALDEYIPAIIFLRHTCRERSYRNPNACAAIVIDDPLLRRRYGFIDFQRLLVSAREHHYRVSLAFIPWNYWRSQSKEVRRFLEYSDCFGICVHGCDHTKNEFKSNNYDRMVEKCFLATKRMRLHQQNTGLACEPLMVCPQEQYSKSALRAFADSGQFLGVVNTSCLPRDLEVPSLRGADLLSPTQDSFYGLPIFKRHYGIDMAPYAMALFLGKPAIMASHHDFFRNGPVDAEYFAAELRRISPKIKWNSLFDMCSSTYLRRTAADGVQEIRFFTNTVQIENKVSQNTEYRLSRRLPLHAKVRRVTVNQQEVPFSRRGEELLLQTTAANTGKITLKVEMEPIEPVTTAPSSLRYQCSVAARRALSEFRDNVISRNRLALQFGRTLMKRLKQTSSG